MFVNVQTAVFPSWSSNVAVGPLPGPLGVTVPTVRPSGAVTPHVRSDSVQPLGTGPSVTVRVVPNVMRLLKVPS